jgi:hypothetical protein
VVIGLHVLHYREQMLSIQEKTISVQKIRQDSIGSAIFP